MAEPSEIQAIERVVRRAALRLRWQRAFEAAATSAILAAALALALVYLVRSERLSPALGGWLLAAVPLLLLAAAALGFRKREPEELVARRIDRASGLADRLSTALTFSRMLARGELADTGDDPDVTAALMRAAIDDGRNAVSRARVEAATPFTWPRDLRAALAFTALCALVGGIALPSSRRPPRLVAAIPDHAPAGATIRLTGSELLAGATWKAGPTPANGSVFLGEGAAARPVEIERWTATEVTVRVPAEAPLGETQLTAYLGKQAAGPVRFVVVDARDERFHKEDAVALDDPELDYLRALLADIRLTAKQDQAEALEDYAAKVEKLLEQAERGELTKEQLLREMEKAQAEMDRGAESSPDQVAKELAETGKELAKNELTKELGKALEKNALDQARQELEKLADQLEQKQLSPKEQEKLAKTLEQVAKRFEERQKEQERSTQQQRQELEEQLRLLEKQQREAKTERDQKDAELRLQKKKEELARLEKKERERQQSAQREAVKRLHKDMEQAAERLQQQDQEQQEQQEQASRDLKDAARETGRVEKEQRKQAAQKRVATQMEDLKEAMRRAKQKGQKGPQNPFGKERKQSDFAARARGQQGNRSAWRPGQAQKGQGQGQGQQGQGQQGQQGQQPGGDTWGTGHDDNLAGDPTGKSGLTKDEDLQGIQGKGPSRRETILAAAQKGFASAKYQEIYTDYKRIVEEVMRSEKVPSSYKYYVKRYFNQIKPKN